MSPKLKALSGKELLSIFQSFGFSVAKQRGSHIKLRRFSPQGEKQILTIILHSDIDKGTLKAILRQASRYIPSDQLQKAFYSE